MESELTAAAMDPFGFPEQILRASASKAESRLELWIEVTRSLGIQRMAEIGVYRGDFAAGVLQSCRNLTRYYMVDPWRHLDNWNKPANQDDPLFEEFFREARMKTEFAAAQRVILRGTTAEVIHQVSDGELDLAYIDGDHTLRGIAIDLIQIYPKVRSGGFVGGDDFTSSIWEHKTSFEPTLVFPFAVYFAEAVGATIYALPFSQFCLQKPEHARFAFVDLTGQYRDVSLRSQVHPQRLFKLMAGERFPRMMRAARRAKNWIR